MRQHVGDHEIEGVAAVNLPAAAVPVEIAETALDVEVAQSEPAQGREVDVGELGESDCVRHAA
jgi:hypothetical protein